MSDEISKVPSSCSNAEESAVDLLARGLLELYEPPLREVEKQLQELTQKQEEVLTTISTERKNLDNLQNNVTADALLSNVAMNRDRLVSISNAMNSLYKRVANLQARAANIESIAKSKASSSKPM